MPHVVPAGRFPESTHTCVPVAHEKMPVLHPGFGFVVQPPPATHIVHAPALQTRPTPHDVPFATFAASMQVVDPLTHEVTPALQGAPGFDVQALPATHIPQKPFASQIWLLPQLVPAGFDGPSTQTEAPVEHDVTPVRHAAFGLVVHPVPSVHEAQAPAAVQTMLVPHDVPTALAASSRQTGLPDWHRVMPVLQVLFGLVVQAAPSVHAEQAPATSQTRLGPQLLPTGLVAASSQAGVAPHDVWPNLHGSGLVVQV